MYFGRDGNPITRQEWEIRLSDYRERVVSNSKFAEIGVEVSTIWFGLSLFDPPLIFETLIIGGELGMQEDRYATEQEAREGHAKWVGRIKQLRSDL